MTGASHIAAIVLAAGASRRFGSDKLLHPLTLRGVTLPLAAHSLLPWLEIFGHVTVVVRPGAERFCSAIETALGESLVGADRLDRMCGCRAGHGSQPGLRRARKPVTPPAG